jgi:hypothetical protein
MEELHHGGVLLITKEKISIKGLEPNALMQKELLEKDGIIVSKDLMVDMKAYRWFPTQDELSKLELDDFYIQELLDKFF